MPPPTTTVGSCTNPSPSRAYREASGPKHKGEIREGTNSLTASSESVFSSELSTSGWALWPLSSCWGSVVVREEPLLPGTLFSSLFSVPVQGESPVNGWVWRP